MTSPHSPDLQFDSGTEAEIEKAARVIRSGGLVAFPTETVYGLGADATNDTAIKKIFAVKGRPSDHPLIIHVLAINDVTKYAKDIPSDAVKLIKAFWPGPLTILLQRRPDKCAVAAGHRPTLALRSPAHPMARELLRRTGLPIAAPSANRFGKISPTTADHVRKDLGPDVDFILDGGKCNVGVESTIVDCTTSPPTLLRPGGISVQELEDALGHKIDLDPGMSRAPGMLESHYAPQCSVVLVENSTQAHEAHDRLRAQRHSVRILDFRDDVVRYAQNLYSVLRTADDDGIEFVVAVLPPATGLGLAVRDRLQKAAVRPN